MHKSNKIKTGLEEFLINIQNNIASTVYQRI